MVSKGKTGYTADCFGIQVGVLLGPIYLYRATRMHSADYAVARCLPVRLCARLSHDSVVSKRLYIS